MPQVKLISPITRQEIRKIRVAAYCRVSSNSADQQNSYANQIRVYTSLIQRKKEWELVEITRCPFSSTFCNLPSVRLT